MEECGGEKEEKELPPRRTRVFVGRTKKGLGELLSEEGQDRREENERERKRIS